MSQHQSSFEGGGVESTPVEQDANPEISQMEPSRSLRASDDDASSKVSNQRWHSVSCVASPAAREAACVNVDQEKPKATARPKRALLNNSNSQLRPRRNCPPKWAGPNVNRACNSKAGHLTRQTRGLCGRRLADASLASSAAEAHHTSKHASIRPARVILQAPPWSRRKRPA